jgi:hypothetical protein
MSSPSLREVMLDAEADREHKAAEEREWWDTRRGLRQARLRLQAKMEHPSPSLSSAWRPRPPAYSPGAIEHKAQQEHYHEPVAIPNSRWQRLDDDTWLRVR